MSSDTNQIVGTIKPKHLVTVTAFVLLIACLVGFLFVPKLSVGLIQAECPACDTVSAIKIAQQIGRLDVISFVLGIVGIGLGFFAIFSFFAVKDEARRHAADVSGDLMQEHKSQVKELVEGRIKIEVERALARALGKGQDSKLPSGTELAEEEVEMTTRQQQKVIDGHQAKAPVPVIAIAEDLGLPVFFMKAMGDDISGMIKKEDDGTYAIYANADHHLHRQRFTIAHEIGHFLLHKEHIGDGIVDDALYRSGLGSTLETEANTMAAEILMPSSLLSKEPLLTASIKDLAKKFKVSAAAMAIRLGEPAYSIVESFGIQEAS